MSLRWYALDRDIDMSGISGTGRVAYALHLPSGRVLVLWDTEFDGEHSEGFEWLPNLRMLRQIHTYGGKTRLSPLDEEAPRNDTIKARALLDDAVHNLRDSLAELESLNKEGDLLL